MGESGIIGRDADLAVLDAFVERATNSAAALALSGDAGVGKTALLDAAAGYARARGVRVLSASGAEFEAGIAFAGLHQLLSPLVPDDGAAKPLAVALGMREGPPPSRAQVTDAVVEVLAAAQPVLVTVDDLHWLDRPSAMVLTDVVRRRSPRRAGFLVTVRAGDAGLDGADVHEVRPLTDEAATAILRTQFPAMARHVIGRLVREAQGNPLALLELPVSLTSDQQRGSSALPETLPLTDRLSAVFAARVSALPASVRRTLLLPALEDRVRLDLVEAAGRDLAQAVRAGLVDVDRGRVTFRHPLTRSAVVALSTSDERRQAHAVLARRLRDRPDRYAWHLAHTAAEPDEHIAGLLEQAAGRTHRRGDTAGAVAALLRAADLSPAGADRSRRLVEAAYLGAVAGGQLRRVPRLLDDAQRGDADPAPALGSAVAAAHYLLLSGEGDIETAHRLLTGALELREGPWDAVVVEAVTTLGWVCYFGGRADLWDAFHHVVARLGPDVPAPVAFVRAFFGDPARAALPVLGELDEAIAALDDRVAPIDVVRTSLAGIFVDRLAACREPLRRLRNRPDAGQAATVELHTLTLLGLERFHAGDWAEAQVLADEHVRLADDGGYQLLRCLGLYLQAMVAAGQGDDAAVVELTNRMVGWAAPRGVTLVSRLAAQPRTLAALGRGDYDSAFRHASTVSPPGVFASHVPHALWFVLDLTESAVRTGRPDEAAAHVAAAREARLDAISPRYRLLVHAAAAMAAPDEEAMPAFEAVLAQPDSGQWPYERARVLLAHGERLRRARLNRQARTQLEHAREIFAGLGAEAWRARAERELRPAGPHRPELLTAQQRTIVRLAAEGLTNKQIAQRLFLSARTVSTHLYQAFPKLGVTSRAGLRDALSRLPEDET
ncbi:LuxR family transcriptional regulator [Amycolatopsis mediterranei S699]|uniref:LuxR family transcriptional regulator n=3 Tax=Amycolatopsis mediterranei TaxID=33910 RepID=A0A0H3DDQ2_AMYMU|nr:LuxR family transcriptional regulator [Amycolatopsis mediterranei]ADJ48208.1 LuxR family transcriptional regulator [Amycolatopsis mediterranei U32]AEK45114.1 LuxR family transcriptional regulator [Amycolatopsis mediterranei S699]AFO79919.1 LuxR family transcriptional regulator [Amycolatopsis mediterranei S699]AGT87047.1 LuxR family transcriptional regulator [Amycolatopsis mediterranei RB]KDO10694.1 LuxR family transcriptional regulator [Amycolatopsis mediterranei]